MKKLAVMLAGAIVAMMPTASMASTDYPKWVDDVFNRWGDGDTMSHDDYVNMCIHNGDSIPLAESRADGVDKDHDGTITKDEYMQGEQTV